MNRKDLWVFQNSRFENEENNSNIIKNIPCDLRIDDNGLWYCKSFQNMWENLNGTVIDNQFFHHCPNNCWINMQSSHVARFLE